MAQRQRKSADLCEFSGCKNRAVWRAHKLWGKGGTICTCDEHRPGSMERPESLKHLPSFYDVQPISPAGQ